MIKVLIIALVGLVVGLVARNIWVKHHGIVHLITLIALAVAGSFVGTVLGQLFGFYALGEWAGFGGSVIGAIIVVLIWRIAFHRHAPPPKR